MESKVMKPAVEKEKVNKRSIGDLDNLTSEERVKLLWGDDYKEFAVIKVTGDIVSPLCKWAD